MPARLTKAAARNIFYGGSAFFLLVYAGLTAHSHYYMVTSSTSGEALSASVERGKHVWEKHSCINCHTILGEGAYFAPEPRERGCATAGATTRMRRAPASRRG